MYRASLFSTQMYRDMHMDRDRAGLVALTNRSLGKHLPHYFWFGLHLQHLQIKWRNSCITLKGLQLHRITSLAMCNCCTTPTPWTNRSRIPSTRRSSKTKSCPFLCSMPTKLCKRFLRGPPPIPSQLRVPSAGSLRSG